jgi:hypothetical protein
MIRRREAGSAGIQTSQVFKTWGVFFLGPVEAALQSRLQHSMMTGFILPRSVYKDG